MSNGDLEIGKRIRDERKRLKWSRSTLAIRTGIHMKRIERIESGAPVYLREAEGLCSALGKEIQWLTLGAQITDLMGEDLSAVRRYRALSREWRNLANGLINKLFESASTERSIIEKKTPPSKPED